jgi:O-antigen/teichoic acid export membrane protein
VTVGGSPRPEATHSGLRSLTRDITGFAGSQYVARAATLLKGFVVAKILGPEGNGLWQHFVLISEYALYSHLGTIPGLNKDLGHRVGERDEALVRKTQNAGTAAVLISAVAMAAGLVLYVLLRGDALHPADRIGLPLVGLIVIAEQINFTYMAILRVHGRIRTISSTTAWFAIMNLVVSVLLLPLLGVMALLVGWLVTRLVTTWIMIRAGGEPFRPRFDRAIVTRLLDVGLPIFFFHLTRVALRNVDRVLVDHVLPIAQLGIYGLAVTLAGLVNYAAEAVGFVIYPVYLRIFGETRDPKRLRESLVKPVEFLSISLPIVMGFCCLVMQLPILWILPEYSSCIEPFRLLSISVVLSSLAVLPGFFLMAVNRQNALVPMGVLTVVLEYFAGRAAIAQGWGLPGVAAVMGVGALVYVTWVMLVAGRTAFGEAAAALRWIARAYVPLAVCAVLVVGLMAAGARAPFASWSEPARAALQGALFLACTFPFLAAYERRHRFVGSLRRRSKSSS